MAARARLDANSRRRVNAMLEKRLMDVKGEIPKAVSKGAHEIAAMQKQLAPEDTGALAASIVVTQPGGTTPPYSQPGGERQAGPFEAIVTAGNSEVRYPHLVEFGTQKASAQPFFWPSFRLLRKRVTNRIKRAVGKGVRGRVGA